MNVAIVVAAGKGSRLGGDRPKQFLELGGIPVFIHTLRQFERSRAIKEVITVLPAEETAGFESVAQQFELKKATRAIAGGAMVLLGISAVAISGALPIRDALGGYADPIVWLVLAAWRRLW